jgi:hypothetical protein
MRFHSGIACNLIMVHRKFPGILVMQPCDMLPAEDMLKRIPYPLKPFFHIKIIPPIINQIASAQNGADQAEHHA